MASKTVKDSIMKLQEDILNELKGISSAVAAVPYVNVFRVHEGYFAGIGAELQARIAADRAYAFKDISVPEGYFDSLAGNILQKIKREQNISAAEEMAELSFVISAIGNENIFTVPQGYFEQLNFTAGEKTARVVKMNPLRAVYRYAAAAVITGLIGLSVINIVDNKNDTITSDLVVQTASAVKAGNEIIRKGSFENELNNISDKDIEQYLSQNGQDVKAALVASSTDDAALPEATDYLLNENALDEYLKTNNLNN